jgi:asparagine synthase (glutamine-hydrolysing)
VIAVAEGIPFIELTDWDHQRLYALKGEIVRRGVEAITGVSMPVFEKRRFQHGVAAPQSLQGLLSADEDTFRHILRDKFSGRRPAAAAGS